VEGRYSFPIKSVLELSSELVSGIGWSERENDFKFDVGLKEDDREVIFLVPFTDFFGIVCGFSSSSSAGVAAAAPSAGCSADGAAVTVVVVVVNTGRLLAPLTRFHKS
jgi:hypothetical protein